MKSALPTRSASASSASSALRPRRTSATTRWNSVAAGCAISFATVSSACRKLCPARSELAMIVRTSGSCSRSFSARRFSATRSTSVGTQSRERRRPQGEPRAPQDREPDEQRRRTRAATVTITNSPARRLTPAASSSASSRALNPRASANRRPKLVTLSGIQPPLPRSTGDWTRACRGCRPPPSARRRAAACASGRPCRRASRRAGTPRRSTSPIARASAAGLPQKRGGDRDHSTPPRLQREDVRVDEHTSLLELVQELRAAGRSTSGDLGTCPPRSRRPRSRTGRCPGG